jgi:hypothetical protein
MHRRSLQWETLEALPMEEAQQPLAKPFGIDVSPFAVAVRTKSYLASAPLSRFKIVTRRMSYDRKTSLMHVSLIHPLG